MRTFPRPSVVLTGLAAALLLSGCAGSASPGVAARVGDDTITTARVDEATGHMCEALGEAYAAEGRVVQLGQMRQGVLQLLAVRSQAEQLLEAYDLEPSAQYESQVSERRRTAAEFPEEARETYVEVFTAEDLANDAVQQVGAAIVAEEGLDDATEEQVMEVGSEAFLAWPDDNDLETNPIYGVELVDGSLRVGDRSLAFPVSDAATAAIAETPDPDYAASLPSNQRCGA